MLTRRILHDYFGCKFSNVPQIYKTSGFIKEYGFPTKTGDLYSCLVLILMSILSVIPKAISTTCIY